VKTGLKNQTLQNGFYSNIKGAFNTKDRALYLIWFQRDLELNILCCATLVAPSSDCWFTGKDGDSEGDSEEDKWREDGRID
jgi:hypothetical protein